MKETLVQNRTNPRNVLRRVRSEEMQKCPMTVRKSGSTRSGWKGRQDRKREDTQSQPDGKRKEQGFPLHELLRSRVGQMSRVITKAIAELVKSRSDYDYDYDYNYYYYYYYYAMLYIFARNSSNCANSF